MPQANQEMTFVRIGAPEDFPKGIGREVRCGSWNLAVFRTTDDRFFALDNRTPHPKGGTLAEAIVSGHFIYCPIRNLKIALKNGMVQAPDSGQVHTYEIKAEEGAVSVCLTKAITCEHCSKQTGDGPAGNSWVCEDCKVTLTAKF